MGAAESVEHVEQVDKISLKMMRDKKSDEFVYIEAGKDFVDALLSFLTLPLGTIARLVAKESNIEAVKFGSISSLYQSLKDLEEKYLWNPTCKDMLLYPRNPMEAYCRKLRMNIDDTEPMKYFVCENLECISKNRLSLFRNQMCGCGKVLNRVMSPSAEYLCLENGFVKENATFIISDDLHVMPNVFGTVVYLHQKHKITNIEDIEEKTLEFSKKSVLDILKFALVPTTHLTDFVLKKKHFPIEIEKKKQSEFKIREVKSDKVRQMSVKVVRRKSTGYILFVEAGEDFVDFVFSFLTFPLGGALHMLEGFSFLKSFELSNLYKSVSKLSPDINLMSQGVKEKLTKPLIAAQFELSNQILPIRAASLPDYYFHSYVSNSQSHVAVTTIMRKHDGYSRESFVPLNLVDPKFSSSKSSNSGEYVKGPSIYMVTDDLVVSPMSSFTAISYLNSLYVPLLDVEEKVVRIGPKEGLSILKASMTSTSALTNGLNQFIKSTIKEDKRIK